jgi:hypothetical protein
VRAAGAALFDKYSVDLVINGHKHLYERTEPLKGGKVTRSAPIGSTINPPTQGTTYKTAGGGGESLYAFTAPDSYEGVDNDSAVGAYYLGPGGTQVVRAILARAG